MGEKDTYTQSDEARDWEFVRLVEEIRAKEREYDTNLTDWLVAEAEARGYCGSCRGGKGDGRRKLA